jgi:hypothetical protein
VTNAVVKQLSSAQRTRETATNALISEAQTGFSALQDSLASTSKNIQTISVQISKEVKRIPPTIVQVLTLGTDRGARFGDSRLSFRHHRADIHTPSGYRLFG